MTTQTEFKKVRLSVSNAVHSLSVLVAHEEGLFRDEGLDVELMKTAGSAHVNTAGRPEAIFDRPLETLYNSGGGWTSSAYAGLLKLIGLRSPGGHELLLGLWLKRHRCAHRWLSPVR